MYKDEIEKIINSITETNDIEYNEIPNISLYMEQVLTFLNEELSNYKLNDNDKLYTKSMINNYVKCNLLSKPINKKYSPSHVVELILIFYLKQILTIDDIKHLFDNTIDKSNVKSLYDNYINYTKDSLSDFDSEIINYTDMLEADTNINDKEAIFILISILNAKASAYKLFSQRLINKLNEESVKSNHLKEKKAKDNQKKEKDKNKDKNKDSIDNMK